MPFQYPPRVSVIVPNYRHARFLTERLDSILNQSFSDFELIFLDDASPDNSLTVFYEYVRNRPDPRIRKPIVNEKNSGSPFIQWNRGVQEARGEFIWIAESDDSCDSSLLSELVTCFDSHPEISLAYCASLVVSEAGSNHGLLPHELEPENYERWQRPFVNSGNDEIISHLSYQCTIPNASSVLFRKSRYFEVGGAATKYRLFGDWITWSKIIADNYLCYIPLAANKFRKHSETVRAETQSDTHILLQHLQVMHSVRGRFSTQPELFEVCNKKNWFLLLRYLRHILCGHPDYNKILRVVQKLDPSIHKKYLIDRLRYAIVGSYDRCESPFITKLKKWLPFAGAYN